MTVFGVRYFFLSNEWDLWVMECGWWMMGDDFLAMTIIFVCGEGWMWVVRDGF